MRGLATIAVALSLGLFADAPCFALSQINTDGAASAEDVQPESLPQPQALTTSERRPRTRLRVRPAYPYRHYHSVYPLPYHFDYPGPNAKRECTARYVQEFRPSGTVIVPRMNCRWVRG
jgi:hypothetical protein